MSGVLEQDGVKIMIAIPSRDVWKSDFGMSLTSMVAASVTQIPGLSLILNNAKGASLAMNRNDLCQKALDHNCDYILFCDDDMRVPMGTLMFFLKRQVDIIAANCARREFPPSPTAKGFDDMMVYTRAASTGVEKVKSVGTGIMMIHTSVFKDLPKPWFQEDALNRIGEDVWFCNTARNAGYDIFIDHDVSKDVIHIGEFEYCHQLMDGWQGQEKGAENAVDHEKV